MRNNSRVTETVLRRVAEFEHEFIEKAIAAEEDIAAGSAPTIEEAIEALQLIGVLTNGLVLLNVSSFVQQIIIGLVLISAVAFDQFATRARRQGS